MRIKSILEKVNGGKEADDSISWAKGLSSVAWNPVKEILLVNVAFLQSF